MRRNLRALAIAGNAAALVLLVLVLARRDALFGEAPPLSALPPPETPAAASRVLVVVVDALRADRAGEMPRLAALARAGGRGRAQVESLVPSTIAGIRELAEGVPPPPASFAGDFGTSTASHGGIFAAAAAAGRSSFAAGPRLWEDLYGPWLSGTFRVETVRGDDPRVLRAALQALRRHDLVVVHFGAPDDAAHVAGARSPAYAAALARCDAALGELLDSAPPGTAVLVTSDHGVSDRGGHAGREPAVREVPVVVHGPGLPRGDLGVLRQRDLHRLILQPLGLALAPPAAAPPAGSRWTLLPALVALLAGLAIWSHLAAGREHPRTGFVLKASLWTSLALSFVDPAAAIALAAGALVLAPWNGPAPGREEKRGLGVKGLFLLAAACAGLRLLDGLGSHEAPLPLPSPLDVAVTAVLGIAAGVLLRRCPGFVQGLAAAVVPVLLARFFLGETASLSTLDVRAAFHLVDGPLGLTGAAALVLLRQSLPFLAVLLGLLARPQSGVWSGRLAAGLGAAVVGQATVAALLFTPGMDPELASLALGLLVRLIGEATALFLGSAVVLGVAWLRQSWSTGPEGRAIRPEGRVTWPVGAATALEIQVIPAEGQATPAKGRGIPVTGQATPTPGQATAILGQATPVSSRTAAVVGRVTPTSGQATPVSGRMTAISGRVAAVLGRVTPAAGRVAPDPGQDAPGPGPPDHAAG